MTEEELLAADPIAADAVICASHRLGDLAQRQRIVPVPEGLREDAAWGDLFELPQLREASWADRTLAVPFGSPVLTCYYRADLLEKLGQKPPQTWSEYQKLAALLVDPAGSGDPSAEAAARSGTIEPLGPGWAGIVLLARAASYAKHRNNYSALFDIRTMEPLVAGPPFIRALEELVAAAEVGAADQLQYDPSAVRAAFWQGRGGMALTWPTRAAEKLPENVPAEIRVGFVELPGSQQAFDVGDQKWDARGEGDETHVPLLAIAGRIGVVSAGSTQPDAAFQLLLWLSGDPTGSKVCGASGATTLFRHSQLKSPQAWVETPVLPSSAAQYAEVTAKTFRRQQWMAALRIPGRAEYLAALDEAVHQAVRDRRPAAEVLQEAVVRWKEITGRLGVEGQKAAYRHGLGLD
ncbi:MAG: extracellular solute-binding protein [Pirellulales bacterium]|nr:extracellular solute-binding protein [Pirellulales bacterium]